MSSLESRRLDFFIHHHVFHKDPLSKTGQAAHIPYYSTVAYDIFTVIDYMANYYQFYCHFKDDKWDVSFDNVEDHENTEFVRADSLGTAVCMGALYRLYCDGKVDIDLFS
jgi:hypothetical protein